jgi:hypothetical protein
MAQPPGSDDDEQRPESTPPTPWQIDPLNPPPEGSRAADRLTSASTGGLSPARHALLSFYASLDNDLRAALSKLDPSFAVPEGTATAFLTRAVTINADRSGDTRPAIHPLQVAFATMRLMDPAPGPDKIIHPHDREGLSPILRYLHTGATPPAPPLPEDIPGGGGGGAGGGAGGGGDAGDGADQADADLYQALLTAVQMDPHERWTTFWRTAGAALADELKPIKVAWCDSDLVEVEGRAASRVTTRLVIDNTGGPDVKGLAAAVMPDNWSHCNDFFCSLTRRDDLNAECLPPASGGEFTVETIDWRGVYQEKVGSCPEGWFPDTFLLFTWLRSDTQLVMRYQLAPRGLHKRGVLDIDEGYLQVDAFEDRFEVSTVKYLLFDDEFIAGGGQTLGRAACQLGWLDYSINQFTACAQELADRHSEGIAAKQAENDNDDNDGNGDNRRANGFLTGDIAAALKRCENNIAETAEDTNRQLGQIVKRLRAGEYDLQAATGDLGQAVARGIRDGARSIVDQQDLLTAYMNLIDGLTRRQKPRGGGRR